MNHIIACGDTLQLIQQVKPASIDLLVTSPPYWAKRVYNGQGEIGSEATPEAYVSRLADFFDELRPYLKPTANIFINVGDTYLDRAPEPGANIWTPREILLRPRKTARRNISPQSLFSQR